MARAAGSYPVDQGSSPWRFTHLPSWSNGSRRPALNGEIGVRLPGSVWCALRTLFENQVFSRGEVALAPEIRMLLKLTG